MPILDLTRSYTGTKAYLYTYDLHYKYPVSFPHVRMRIICFFINDTGKINSLIIGVWRIHHSTGTEQKTGGETLRPDVSDFDLV